MSPKEADEWVDKGYHTIRLFHRNYYYKKDKATLIPYNCGYNAIVNDLLGRTNQPQWLDWIEKLSGAESMVIGSTTYTIIRRPSSALFSGDVNAKAYDYLLQQVQSYHYGSNIEEDPYIYSTSTWKNFILTIPGQTTPNDIVAYSAHMDGRPTTGIAPGADDDGTGVATILEGARLLRQYRFQRTIKIIFFSGEEEGLVGSGAYVADHPMTNFLGVLHQDMFGYDPDVDRCFEMHIGTLSTSADVANCNAATISAYSLNLTYDYLTTNATSSSDHASFWNVNVGAMKIGENHNSAGTACGPVENNPYYHMSTDTIANAVTLPVTYDIFKSALGTIAAMAIPIQSCFSSSPTLTATPGDHKVDLSWTTVAGAGSYRVFRSTQSCQGQWFEQTSTTDTTYTDINVTHGITYYYYVEAVDSDGFCVSNMSNCPTAIPIIPHASYANNTFTDSCPGGSGDNNGIIEPGETITTDITVSNDGTLNLTNVNGTLSTATPGITIMTGSAAFPDINMGQSANCNAPHYVYWVNPTTVACGTNSNFNLAMSYTQGNNSTSFTHVVGTTSQVTKLNENFATGNPPTGWTVVDGGSGGGTAATWTTANPGARAPGVPIVTPFEIVDSDIAGGSAMQDEQLITPVTDCTGCSKVILQFDNLFYVYSTEVADVDVTTNNGSTWTNVLHMIASDGYPIPNTKVIDITSAIAGNPATTKIRWHYYNGSFEWWWAIDNVRVLCENPVCTTCNTVPGYPGYVPGTLTVAKAGSNFNLAWTSPGGICTPIGYGLYRGTLPWTSYDHASVNCAIPATSATTPQDTDSYYYLIVPYNNVNEGSYGKDSSGTERPQGSSPCKSQTLSPCN